jgi:hypothetical protein
LVVRKWTPAPQGSDRTPADRRDPSFKQAINGVRIFGNVFLGEGLWCKLRDSAARRHRDVLQGFLQAALHGTRNLVEHVDCLALPAELPPHAGEDFDQHFPEAKRQAFDNTPSQAK